MSKPAIKSADPFEYATPGYTKASVDARHPGIKMETHFCTGYLDYPEALRLTIQLIHAGQQQWGHNWREQIQCYLEQEM